ncbi:ABC transporter ATP-binding protein [Mucilaginibacter limnophilus]|uniref:ABC transporter ATP-binding protein n=1 Tax=Mucilaginibacter limnophilus TaxID=1932778 RepID=A0A437MQV6_9SPHI|nr:ABC transporter ATP-binding protein [Mucilaginibacter limnophilus]RVU00034.1 ABC transporter ATP-binding protein [Mucilaginibacter limnophilus]
MTEKPFLQAVGISRVFTGTHHEGGVKDITLNIIPGKITAIIGTSGSGKTTLLKLLFGLLSPEKGKVLFEGERIWGPEEKLIPGHDAMKMVTQHTDDLNLFAKVWDNIAVLLPNTDIATKQARTEEVLRQLNMLHLADKRVFDLSGGEKQRVAIARAIATRPRVLLLDEPFNQVDASFREGLQQDIRQIVADTGLTVIMVSHDPAEVLSMADELIVLKDGKVLETGSPKQLYQNPANLYTAQLLTNCNVLSKADAKLLGIHAKKETVVIYPHYIDVSGGWALNRWVVKNILFKGFYEELVLDHDGITARAFNKEQGKFKAGDKVTLKAWGYLEY